ncbi:MAG: hypothetical protein LBF78_12435 [Treponema sp.]|jgi:hypothetical protein|nr:hypothetical protein [Treponema sp.]
MVFIFCAIAALASCSRKEERKPAEPRTISVRGAEISGNWKNFIEIEDGDYLLEDLGHSSWSRKTTVTVSLKLKKTFSGALNSPADTLRLIPLTRGGSAITNDEFLVSSKDKFNEFIRGAPGEKARITFADLFGNEEVFPDIAGFEGKTVEESRPEARAAGSANPADGPKDTATDPGFARGTAARTGPRVVAVPELEATGSISKDLIVGITGAVTSSLLANSNVSRVVDYNQISRIMAQHKFEAGEWSNPAKYAEIGRALNVDTITIGTISLGQKLLFMQEYNVSVQLIDISTMSVVGACTVSCDESFGALKNEVKKMEVKR